LLPVAAILFVGAGLLGAGELKDLALVLFVGMLSGTYSSIFIATPVLAQLKEREPQFKALAKRVALRESGGRAAKRAAAKGPAAKGAVGKTASKPGAAATATAVSDGPEVEDVEDADYDSEDAAPAGEKVPAGRTAPRPPGPGARPGPRQQPRRPTAKRRPSGKKKRR